MKTVRNIMYNHNTFECGYEIIDHKTNTKEKFVGQFSGEWKYELLNGNLIRKITCEKSYMQ
jgi:hypothetical protein